MKEKHGAYSSYKVTTGFAKRKSKTGQKCYKKPLKCYKIDFFVSHTIVHYNFHTTYKELFTFYCLFSFALHCKFHAFTRSKSIFTVAAIFRKKHWSKWLNGKSNLGSNYNRVLMHLRQTELQIINSILWIKIIPDRTQTLCETIKSATFLKRILILQSKIALKLFNYHHFQMC
ncbi:hypothetical protein BH09BAC5_BH09BAC5_27690 [soil metagenome]